MAENNGKSESNGGRRTARAALSLGTNMAAAFFVFGLLGFYVDRRLGGGYTWTTAGACLAMTYSFYEVWKLVRRMDAEEAAKPKEQEAGHAPSTPT